jgi:hypothetical protein
MEIDRTAFRFKFTYRCMMCQKEKIVEDGIYMFSGFLRPFDPYEYLPDRWMAIKGGFVCGWYHADDAEKGK